MRGRFATLAACSATLLSLGCVSGATAADEIAAADISMNPSAGGLFHELPRPVDWRVEAEVTAPPESNLVLPMKRIRVSFPKEMSFHPDPSMPVCPDSKVGPPPTYISEPPETIIARCSRSVVGNGSAKVYLAAVNAPGGPNLTDGVLVIFNGGRNRVGSPRLKVYGFSASLATGLYFEGVMKKNILLVDIGQLPVDSAVGELDLNIPGSDSPFPDRRGGDPRYVRAICADGQWSAFANFTLGRRDSDGSAAGPESVVRSPTVVKPCAGAAGSPRPKLLRDKLLRRGGGNLIYRVTVRNSGTASAHKVLLRARGRGISGRRLIRRIPPRTTKSVKVKVKRRTGTSRVPRFTLRSRWGPDGPRQGR